MTTVEVDTREAPSVVEKRGIFSRLSRVTTSGKFIPEIDGFRFIAISSVFSCHLLGQVMAKNRVGMSGKSMDFGSLSRVDRVFAGIVNGGGFGVELFFVISGFILCIPFAEHYLFEAKKPKLKAYLLRRVTRLEPPYILNLIVYAIAGVLYYHWALGSAFGHWIASVFYVQNQVFGDVTAATTNAVTWSLEVEVQFYLLAPFLAAIFLARNTRQRRAILGSIVLACAIFNSLLGKPPFRYEASILFSIQYFLTGFLLADIYLMDRTFLTTPRKSLRWDAVAALAAVAMVGIVFAQTSEGSLSFLLPLLILLFYVAGFKGRVANWFFRRPAVYLIGGMCYTIYLWHILFIAPGAVVTRRLYVHSWPLWVNYGVQWAVHAGVVLAASIVLFQLIERPCMKRDWPARLWGRARGQPVAREEQ